MEIVPFKGGVHEGDGLDEEDGADGEVCEFHLLFITIFIMIFK